MLTSAQLADLRLAEPDRCSKSPVGHGVFVEVVRKLHGAEECASRIFASSIIMRVTSFTCDFTRSIVPGMASIRQKHQRNRTFLREWRLHRHLTQERAAERLGIDQSTLSRIERGQHPYDQDFLETAAEAYRCEPADLIVRNPLAHDAIWSIVDNLRKAPQAQQEQVRAVLDALLKTGS